MRDLLRLPGARLVLHAAVALLAWLLLVGITGMVDPLMNYYIALMAMYATAMFGMTILVGLSGQVSLGNGALMAVGGYVFAVTTLNWETVPFTGIAMNGIWAMLFAAIGGVLIGLLIGGLGARLRGPYLAGLTLGVAVGVPAIANRFPELLGGETGLQLTVPYPSGGYAVAGEFVDEAFTEDFPTEQLDELPTEQIEDLPTEQVEELPTEQDVSGDDLLTLDNFPNEGDVLTEGDVPADGDVLTDGDFSADGDDLLTLDNFPNEGDVLTDGDVLSDGDLSADGDDLLTLDNFPTEDELPADPSAPDGALDPEFAVDPDVEATFDGLDGLDAGFILEQWQAVLAVSVACIVAFLALNLVRGRQGRQWRAVRDDSVAAAVAGISPGRSKVSAFVVSSVFAALAGAVFAQILSYVGPGAFGLGLSLSLLVGVVLGGRGSLWGAVIGAVLLVWLPEFVLRAAGDRGWEEQVTNNAPNLIYGLLVVAVVLVAPGGIVGSLQSLVRRVRRTPASPSAAGLGERVDAGVGKADS